MEKRDGWAKSCSFRLEIILWSIQSYIHVMKIKSFHNGDQLRPFLWGFIESVVIR